MDTKYIFETNDSKEMNLIVNKNKLVEALEELSNWRRELYKSYDNDIKYVCNGKIYNHKELHEDKSILRDEHGTIKGCKEVYIVNDIIDHIDRILSEVNNLID